MKNETRHGMWTLLDSVGTKTRTVVEATSRNEAVAVARANASVDFEAFAQFFDASISRPDPREMFADAAYLCSVEEWTDRLASLPD